VSPRMRAALAAHGSEPPKGEECPTGAELVEKVFEPVAALPEIAPHLRLGHRVLEVGREGLLKNEEIGTGRRSNRPFRLLLRTDAGERIESADIVLDCTGTYHNPNALGSGGIRAPGEADAEEWIIRRIPNFEAPKLNADSPGWAGQRILLVGAGHSAQTAAMDLEALLARVPSTRVVWAIRSEAPTFGAIENDGLPARASLVAHATRLAGSDSPFDVRLGRSVEALRPSPDGIVATLGTPAGKLEEVTVDWILSLTGSVGDARIYRQLQVHECYATSGPMNLAAALLSASSADCLTQVSPGADTLKNPEPGFFIVGSKSYGRNTTFLLRVGWEQVDQVFSLIRDAIAPAGTLS
ncbi:MAG: hypothetical protein OEN00_10800, partial [Gemmatimonadota bacterium]|nr:hypothetical protein [Gemmatimonadota bacterium]